MDRNAAGTPSPESRPVEGSAQVKEPVQPQVPGTSEVKAPVDARPVTETAPTGAEASLADIRRMASDQVHKLSIGARKLDPTEVWPVLKKFLEEMEAKGIPHVDLSKIFLRQLPGEAAGKSTDARVEIDPVGLLNPEVRLSYLWATMPHELLHGFGKVDSEGLVEYMCDTMGFYESSTGGALVPTEKYNEAKDNTAAFIRKAAEYSGKPEKEVGEEIYQFYYEGKPDFIPIKYVDIWGREPKKFDEMAILFGKAFPEIQFITERSKFGLKPDQVVE